MKLEKFIVPVMILILSTGMTGLVPENIEKTSEPICQNPSMIEDSNLRLSDLVEGDYGGNYSDDFSSSTYTDGPNTNVTGWGTGSLALPTAGTVDPSLVGSVSTYSANEIIVDGNWAYVANIDGDTYTNGGVAVVNITDVTDPQVVTTLTSNAQWATDFLIEGDTLFIGTEGDVEIFNITDPSLPVYLDTTGNSGYQTGIAISGNYLYGTDYQAGDGLLVSNITNPSQTSIIKSDNSFSGQLSVEVQDNFLYLGSSILNITNPSNPVYLGWTGASGDHFVIDSDWMYVAYEGGLKVINITDPTNPSVKTTLTFTGGTTDWSGYNFPNVAVEGNTLFYANLEHGIRIYDITNPINPVLLHTMDTDQASAFDTDGEYLYLADGSGGVKIIKYKDYATPSVESISGDHGLEDYAIRGNYAYAAGYIDMGVGVAAYNITDPTNIVKASEQSTGDESVGPIVVQGDYAYTYGDGDGLRVFNITDPYDVQFISALNFDYYVYSSLMKISGNILYAQTDTSILQIFNITTPHAPVLIKTISFGAGYGQIHGNTMYVVSFSNLRIYNITDPVNPTLENTISGIKGNNIEISGNYLYTADQSSLYMVNITNPLQPVIVNSLTSSAYKVGVDGNRLYTVDYDNTLAIFNITDPSNGHLLGEYELFTQDTNYAYSVQISGAYAFLGTSGGLMAVKIAGILPQTSSDYATPRHARSTSLDSGTQIVSAVLEETVTKPAGTSITHYLSIDGGDNWYMVTPGTSYPFLENGITGSDLRWRAVLSTSDTSQTPSLDKISIKFQYKLSAPDSPSLSTLAIYTNDSTPTLMWEGVKNATGYIIEIDTAFTYDTNDYLDYTTSVNGSYTLPTALPKEGIWFWRIASLSGDNRVSDFTSNLQFTLDMTAPEITGPGLDDTYTFTTGTTGHNLSWSASDTNPGNVRIYRNSSLNVSSSWFNDLNITYDLDNLEVGNYEITVVIMDLAGNKMSIRSFVQVRDEVANTEPTDTTTDLTSTTSDQSETSSETSSDTGTSDTSGGAGTNPPSLFSSDNAGLLAILGILGLGLISMIALFLRRRAT